MQWVAAAEATGIQMAQTKARLVVQAADRELTSPTTHLKQLALQDKDMAAACRVRTGMEAQQVVAVLVALARMADLQRQQTISAQVRTRARIRRLVEMVASAFSHQSLAVPNGTAVAAVAARTQTPGHLARAVLAAKVAAVMVHGVPTALVKMEPTARVAAVVVATVRAKAVMAEVALSLSRMFSLLLQQLRQQPPLQLRHQPSLRQQPPLRLLALRRQRLLLHSTLW
jgi:hypothetical protein